VSVQTALNQNRLSSSPDALDNWFMKANMAGFRHYEGIQIQQICGPNSANTQKTKWIKAII
jgi:hypothetical protein